MGRLRERVLAMYGEHYARVNRDEEMGPRLRAMEAMYGEFVASLPAGSRVLDLGCGAGFLLSWLGTRPGIVPVGVDRSMPQVEVARRRLPGVAIICEDGLRYLRNNRNGFAGIFCLDVLEHVPGEDRCLNWVEMALAALHPGGFFLCRVPNAASLIGNHSRWMDLTHERLFTSTSILELLRAGGLKDCRVVPFRAAHFLGRVQVMVEAAVHRGVFWMCRRRWEGVFTKNVCAVGFA